VHPCISCASLYARPINALAKKLHRQNRNVYDDVKILERLSLVEKDEKNLFFVPWDEIDATFRLAA
jgi:predicted transcriptional regulator